jgi:RimJ/RimL family protein N-acetyltransferase
VTLRPDYPIITPRLRLRPLGFDDLDALLSYHALPEVHRYLPMDAFDREAAAERLRSGPWSRSAIESPGDQLTMGVQLADGVLVGDLMLMWQNEKHRRGEIGYVFHPDHAHRGYATEAAHALLHVAFDDFGLHRVTAMIVGGNDASVRVAGRLGLRQEAHLVESVLLDGEWMDQLTFAILEQEWRAQEHGAGCRAT